MPAKIEIKHPRPNEDTGVQERPHLQTAFLVVLVIVDQPEVKLQGTMITNDGMNIPLITTVGPIPKKKGPKQIEYRWHLMFEGDFKKAQTAKVEIKEVGGAPQEVEFKVKRIPHKVRPFIVKKPAAVVIGSHWREGAGLDISAQKTDFIAYGGFTDLNDGVRSVTMNDIAAEHYYDDQQHLFWFAVFPKLRKGVYALQVINAKNHADSVGKLTVQ